MIHDLAELALRAVGGVYALVWLLSMNFREHVAANLEEN